MVGITAPPAGHTAPAATAMLKLALAMAQLLPRQEDSPDGSPAEVTVCMSVTELNLDATRCRLALTKGAGEARRAGVRFTAPVGLRAVVTLAVNTGARCKHTGEPH